MKSSLLGNSAVPNYVKITATGILASTYICALLVATYDMMANLQAPNVVTFILGTGLSMSLGILGLHQGASLAEAAPQASAQQTAQGANNASTTTA
jgi:hypothetical protein